MPETLKECFCGKEIKENLYSSGRLFINYRNLQKLPTNVCSDHALLITHLYAAKNRIDELNEEDIRRFCNLIELYMPHNCLIALHPYLGFMKNLETIVLEGNQISHLPSEISNLKNLKKLILRDNQLKKLPERISSLSNLKILDLSLNNFKHFPTCLLKCEQLDTLLLTSNLLKWIPPEICEMKSLKKICVSFNQLLFLPIDFGDSSIEARFSSNPYLHYIPSKLASKLHFCRRFSEKKLEDNLLKGFNLKLIKLQTKTTPVELIFTSNVVSEDTNEVIGSLQEILLQYMHKKNFNSDIDWFKQMLAFPPRGHCFSCQKPIFIKIIASYGGEVVTSDGSKLHLINYFCSNSCSKKFNNL